MMDAKEKGLVHEATFKYTKLTWWGRKYFYSTCSAKTIKRITEKVIARVEARNVREMEKKQLDSEMEAVLLESKQRLERIGLKVPMPAGKGY
jgi:hypothetical protein